MSLSALIKRDIFACRVGLQNLGGSILSYEVKSSMSGLRRDSVNKSTKETSPILSRSSLRLNIVPANPQMDQIIVCEVECTQNFNVRDCQNSGYLVSLPWAAKPEGSLGRFCCLPIDI